MANVTLFMGPMARKKTVGQKYCPNSYRVISHEAERIETSRELPADIPLPKYTNPIGQTVDPNSLSEHRNNRPNATSVGFLAQDVMLLNEPICHVRTRSTLYDQHRWWPARENPPNLHKPTYTLDTTFRKDYRFSKDGNRGSARHTSNPNKRPALGTVPVNHLRDPNGKQRVWKEGISYEHQFDSRIDPQYPIRGKRHGAFVWDKFADSEVKRMIEYFGQEKSTPPSPKNIITKQSPASAPVQMQSDAENTTKNQSEQEPKDSKSKTVLPPIGY